MTDAKRPSVERAARALNPDLWFPNPEGIPLVQRIACEIEQAERAAEQRGRDAALEEAAALWGAEDHNGKAILRLKSTPATTAPRAAEAEAALLTAFKNPTSSPTLTGERVERRIAEHFLAHEQNRLHVMEDRLDSRISDLEQQGQYTHSMVIAAERETDKLDARLAEVEKHLDNAEIDLHKRIAAVERMETDFSLAVRTINERLSALERGAPPPERSEAERLRDREEALRYAWERVEFGGPLRNVFVAGFDAGWNAVLALDAAQSKDGG